MGLTKPRAAQIFNLDYKQSTRVVTATNITLAGGAPNAVDGVNLSVGDRVLVTGQSTASQNGLYLVTTLGSGANGTWARTSDGNENGEIEAGMIVMVTEGTEYGDTQWKLSTNDPIVIGTTALTFVFNVQTSTISSGTSNVVVNANANVTISSSGTANVLTVSNTGASVSGIISVSGNMTGGNISTSGVISATGNVAGNFFIGNGSQLTGISGGSATSINNGTSNVNVVSSGGNVTASVGGTSNVVVFATTGVFVTGLTSITGNITGGNLLTAGLISATGNLTVNGMFNNGSYSGVGNVFAPNVDVGLGTVFVGNVVNTNANSVGNIGSSGLPFNTVFAKATSAQYADLAEMYLADAGYVAGTVMEFGGSAEVTQSSHSHSIRVAGIVSTNPSYLMNATLTGQHVLPVALVGRVPCQVVGTIAKGDRLVTSDISGVATTLDLSKYQPACIIGKSLENYDSPEVGVIEVAVGRT